MGCSSQEEQSVVEAVTDNGEAVRSLQYLRWLRWLRWMRWLRCLSKLEANLHAMNQTIQYNQLKKKMYSTIQNKKVLITGGAGFIGSNLCEDLLKNNNQVVCLDNFSTGQKNNIIDFLSNPNFRLIDGDIRQMTDCKRAVVGVDIVLHQAALGSVPRSLVDPINTNENNITGFLNMLVAARDEGVKRFVYAASSSTYGDSENLPKIEEIIGKPLSPYAVTKYVNELYAHVFGLNYSMEIIGLRYFNVYGRKQDPSGAYAAVIPLFVKQFMNYESPVINGDGTFSRDFTYIDNVIQMNHLAATTTNKEAIGQVFNTAVGERTTLLQLAEILKKYLSEYDPKITEVEIKFGPERKGDIPHSLASVEKAEKLLGYKANVGLVDGLRNVSECYFRTLKNKK